MNPHELHETGKKAAQLAEALRQMRDAAHRGPLSGDAAQRAVLADAASMLEQQIAMLGEAAYLAQGVRGRTAAQGERAAAMLAAGQEPWV